MSKTGITKKFTGILVLNWDTGDARYVKKKATKMSPYEIPVRINININVPKFVSPEISGDIDMPEIKATEIMLKNMGD